MITLNGSPVYAQNPWIPPGVWTESDIPISWNNKDLLVLVYAGIGSATTLSSVQCTGLPAWQKASQVIWSNTQNAEVWWTYAESDSSGTINVAAAQSTSGRITVLRLAGASSAPIDVIATLNGFIGPLNWPNAVSTLPNTQALLVICNGDGFNGIPTAPDGYSRISFDYDGSHRSGTTITATMLQGSVNALTNTSVSPPFAGSSITTYIAFTILLNIQQSSSSSSVSSASSGSLPDPFSPIYCRQCRRLAEPSSQTIEQNSGTSFPLRNLTITISMPFDLVNQYVAQIPNTGPDTLVVNYTDNLGQHGQFSRNCTLWMSDFGYILLSTDQSKQFLVASSNASFWQSNALTINARNNTAGAPPLLPCCNTDRYDANTLRPNQAIPSLFVYDGVVLTNPSSSSSGH
jgi:hypothetical protein